MIKSDLIQNTPNSREPMPAAKGVKALSRFLNSHQWTAYFLGMLVFLFSSLLYFSVSGIIKGNMAAGASDAETMLLGISLTGFAIVIGLLYILYRQSANLPAKEQLRYYQLGNVQPLTPEQASALRLNIVEMYHNGFWLKTLEYYPCDVRVDNPKFKPTSFYIADRNVYRQGLNDDWGVVSKAQYENTVSELFDGMHSKLFALDIDYVLNYKSYVRGATPDHLKNVESQNANFVNRLAGLIDKRVTYVTACFEASTDKPKPLIWGFDLWRIIPISREAFMAGYISEAEAWTHILRASDLIHYLFDSFESFYDNLRLGNAYWSNDLKVTTKRLAMWKLYEKECNWPQRTLPWAAPRRPEITDDMHTGFAMYVRSKNKSHQEVGFRLGDGSADG
ncbi:DUF1266 domain-containing protein [Parapedobacter sp.]